MKLIFFQIGEKLIFPENIQDPSDGLHITLALIFSVNEDII